MAAATTTTTTRSLLAEGSRFFASSIPIMLVDFTKLSLVSITMAFVGRWSRDTTALAGASMGSLCFNVAGQMIASAPLAAMDTIAPQAYGAGNSVGVGLAAQRAFILALLFLLPTCACARLPDEHDDQDSQESTERLHIFQNHCDEEKQPPRAFEPF